MSETSIQVFDSPEFGRIRVVRDEGGDPWFVAGDIAKALGYRDAEKMTRRLDDDEKGTRSVGTPGGNQRMSVITEAGMYAAILGSQVEGAKAFRRWVTHEVLPSIRRHGAYMTPEMAERMLNDPDVMIMTLEVLKAERAKVAALVEDNARMLPKATAWDAMVESDGTMSVTKAARSLAAIDPGMTCKRLYALLRADEIFCKRDCTPTRDAIDRGLAVQRIYENKGGHVRAYGHLTAKGLDWCRERYCRREVTPDA